MAVYDLEEQDQIDALKTWWAQWGNLVSIAVIAVCAVVIGVQGWRWYQHRQAEQASVLYNAVAAAQRANDANKARDAVNQLVDAFPGTGDAPRAALLYAKRLWDAGDKTGAKAQLQWVVDRAGEDELKQIARYRLAEALLDEKQVDAALALLDAKTDDAFAGLYADLRGDALVAANRIADAKAAYESALAKLDPRSPYRGYVQVKLDSLPGAKPAAADAPVPPAPAAAAAPAPAPAAAAPAPAPAAAPKAPAAKP